MGKAKFNYKKAQFAKKAKAGRSVGMQKHLMDAVDAGRAKNIQEAAKLGFIDKMGSIKSQLDDKLFKMMHKAKTNKMLEEKKKREGPKLNKMQKDVKKQSEALDKLIDSIKDENHLMKLQLDDFEVFRDTEGSNKNFKIMSQIEECGFKIDKEV